MVNKVLASFMVMDGLFVSMGAIMLGFCVIVRQTAFEAPTEGREAARDLLYRTFPFNGKYTPVLRKALRAELLTTLNSWYRKCHLHIHRVPNHPPGVGNRQSNLD